MIQEVISSKDKSDIKVSMIEEIIGALDQKKENLIEDEENNYMN